MNVFSSKQVLLFLFMLSALSSYSQYKIPDIIAENKAKIAAPYKYDGFLVNEFTIGLVNINIPLEFNAFKNQKYKLVFCSSVFEEPVLVSIYDKAAPSVKIAEKTIDQNSQSWTFEPEKAGTYSIVYEIPPSNTDVEHKACMIMLIGFKDK